MERWNARSEVMLDAGRALSMRRMLRSRAALAEQVPGVARSGRSGGRRARSARASSPAST
ncbi:MAG: hypothetical protein M5U28_56325 [Sandaracinaceae bacterium]|nr:hypothetical protein [Sandaracinaceae bacterium]